MEYPAVQRETLAEPPETFFMQLWIGGRRLKKLFQKPLYRFPAYCHHRPPCPCGGFRLGHGDVLVSHRSPPSMPHQGIWPVTGDFASTIAQRCFEPRLGKAGSSKYKNLEKSLLWKAVDTGGKAGSFCYGARFIVGEGGGFLPRPDKNKVYSASGSFRCRRQPSGMQLDGFLLFSIIVDRGAVEKPRRTVWK